MSPVVIAPERRLIPLTGLTALMACVVSPAVAQGPRIELGGTILAIGVNDTLVEQQFAGIRDAVLTPQGELFVLDARSRVVALFALTGRLIASAQVAAAAGATKTVVTSGGRVFVYDGINGWVLPYDRVRDSLTARQAFRVPPGSDACFIGNSLVVMGLRDGKMLHRYSPSGEHVGSFAEAYETSPSFQHGLANLGGRLACQAEQGLVLVATSLLPEVRAYSADGTLRWVHRLKEFVSPIVKSSDNSFAIGIGPDGTDEVVSIVGVTATLLAVQIERHRRQGAQRRARRETLLLGLDDGVQRGSQVDLPRLARVRDARATVISHDPFPQVRVQSIRVVGAR